jgi:hypothetical protein
VLPRRRDSATSLDGRAVLDLDQAGQMIGVPGMSPRERAQDGNPDVGLGRQPSMAPGVTLVAPVLSACTAALRSRTPVREVPGNQRQRR